ncbi:hypothetical protein J437_LFUL016037 [Ladona fulva]|uniref:EF-hand domain-containing family member C2 n=1 Tax=Ladona fulva TaxID=123851 RepID=A0A8K0KJZ9_LADFU|nr:hypothetical protein J437_LFUL016037 [Ladona fulva]
MKRNASLPFLPGFTFNKEVGKTKFHKPHLLDYNRDVMIVNEKIKSGAVGRPLPGSYKTMYSSIHSESTESRFPAWIVFDKQVLSFNAYFQEMKHGSCQIRRCKIFFYLEDGSIQVIEPKERNSGIPQGTLIHRQRIQKSSTHDDSFYDIADLNIGKEVELFGRVFKIIDCDRFTRVFLNRIGIPVPDPVQCPEDSYMKIREKEKLQLEASKPPRTRHSLAQFLAHDRQVLRFWGYWDDRETPHGLLHHLRLHYYLADDTIEITEEGNKTEGLEMGPVFLRRTKLPKNFSTVGLPGDDFGNPLTVLNVLGHSFKKGHYIYDSLSSGRNDLGSRYEYVTDKDLYIGAALDAYGRNIVLTSCDPFTQEYYRSKYGYEDFTPAPEPRASEREKHLEIIKSSKVKVLPPYNGYGSYEDSAQNCHSIIVTPPKKDFKKFFQMDRQGSDSHLLRFEARMTAPHQSSVDQRFLITYYLSDDTISVFEEAAKNSGYFGGKFLKRIKIPKPGEELFSSTPPEYYLPKDFYVGAALVINEFHFLITDADEYTLNYMEKNCNEFSKSNIRLILDKLREALQPIYKDFVGKYLCIDPDQTGLITYHTFWRSMKDVLGDKITDQEILTLARAFPAKTGSMDGITLAQLRPLVHTELHRNLFHEYDRMAEDLLKRDITRSGWLTKKEIWASCRACQIPLSLDILDAVIERLDRKPNDPCCFSYSHLLQFLDPKELARKIRGHDAGKMKKKDSVDYAELLKCLNLEEEFLKQSK